APAGGARPQRGPARQPETAAPGGLGPVLRHRDELPPGLHGAAAPQAGGRPGAPPALRDRTRYGVPLRAWLTASPVPRVPRPGDTPGASPYHGRPVPFGYERCSPIREGRQGFEAVRPLPAHARPAVQLPGGPGVGGAA